MADVAIPRTAPARVLLIQDQPGPRAEISSALRTAGFEVFEVASGLAGIERAQANPPDLLLLDLHLPDLDGAEVATKLRHLGMQGLPIVALGQPGSERGLALSAGCSGTIPNPPDLARLPGQIRAFLAGKKDKLRGGDEKRYLKEFNESLVEKIESKLRELTATNERLRHIDDFKTEFMQSISHELSTPLTPLAGYLKILQSEKLGALNERQKKIVESMLQSADRLAHTIDNLSDFAVLEIGNYRVRAEPVDAVALAHKVVDDAQATTAKPKRVHVTFRGPVAPITVQADPSRLGQALHNLVDNAVKYSPHGGDVLVEVVSEEGHLSIGVYDQGSGVPPEDQQTIFEPFHHSKGARHVATVGLGLPVARKIAEAHGGRLRVESPPKAQPESERHFTGSKFVLDLPLTPPAPAAAPA